MSGLNIEAWERSAMSFIKSKGMELEFRDYCGDFPTPIDPVNIKAAHKALWMKEYAKEALKAYPS